MEAYQGPPPAMERRPRLVVAGASGFIGTAVCRELVKHYDVTVLTRSHARFQSVGPDDAITWRYCDLYSRKDCEAALAGAEYAIYLVHTRTCSSRLNQAHSEDMDLLLADNFARAASLNSVRQIIFLGGMIAEENVFSRLPRDSGEVELTLASYGTPVTSLHAGIVVGPGGTFVRLLSQMALHFPVIFVPKNSSFLMQPIAVADVVKAILLSIGNPGAFNRHFRIGGPDVLTLRELLQQTALTLGGKRPAIFAQIPGSLYALWASLIFGGTSSATVNFLVRSFQQNTVVSDNPLQQEIIKTAVPFGEALAACIDKETKELLPNPRISTLTKDNLELRFESRVRSIQRLTLPPDWNAEKVVDAFFRWLSDFLWPFLVCSLDSSGSCRYFLYFPRLHLITLKFKPAHSLANRRLYFITEGLLVKPVKGRQPRFEFRDVINNRYTIAAIHDFAPSLPWYIYLPTQAMLHAFVMKAFQRHLNKLARKQQTDRNKSD